MIDFEKDRAFQEIAERGSALYETIKSKYEPKDNGKFLAIEVDSGKVYMGNTGGEALDQACAENPDKLFYVAKIGFTSVATLSYYIVQSS